jgi:two-component system chemotaxis sensor kinase CheA
VKQDPYRYYRVEAEELVAGLLEGVLELERRGTAAEPVRRLLRLAHTLKGASRVVKLPGVAEQSHAIEDVLAPLRGLPENTALEPAAIERLLAALDAIRAQLATLGVTSPPVGAPVGAPAAAPADAPAALHAAVMPPAAAADESLRSVRVGLDELDDLVRLVARIGSAVERVRSAAASAERAPRTQDCDELGREVDELRERVGHMRLLPAEVLFADVKRAARDAAAALGRSVDVQLAGGDIRLDAHVLAAARGALLHVVRNAVAHGIEDAAARAAAGKSATGSIAFAVARAGHRAVFTCADDGRGIDEPAIKQAAARRGVLSAEAAGALGSNEIIELLLKGGVSTTREVDEISGRGIGLETLRDTAARLKGEVEIRSAPGRGATIRLSVPITLSSLPVLAVHAGGASVLIPLDSVLGTSTVDPAKLSATADGEVLAWKDRALPFVALTQLVGGVPLQPRERPRQAVVIRGARGEIALGVDRTLDVREVVLQQLPTHARASPVVAGVALDVAGVPRIVVAPTEIDGAMRRAPVLAEPGDEDALPLLVIDDSLTTRMLEHSILEAAGYQVDLAVSAEDALEKAARRRYGLFIVDVEMPGMNGFEFVARTRADASLASVPCIMVTSRYAPEDRKRGADAGAADYFDKGQFDQDALLASIRRLLA